MWPTPDAAGFNDGQSVEAYEARNAREREKGYNGNGGGTPLGMAVKLYPTPMARDAETNTAHMRGNESLGSVMRTASRATAAGRSRGNSPHDAPPVEESAQASRTNCATPTARDWKDGACRDTNVPTNGLLGRQVTRPMYPTPIASDAQGGPRKPDGKRGRALKDRWPTPMGYAGERPGLTKLDIRARGLYATPTAADSTRGASGRANASLTQDVASWPTPQARDQKGPYRNHTKGGRDLSSEAAWPTPRAHDGRGGVGRAATTQGGPDLAMATSGRWPTPTAGDMKASGSRVGNPDTKAHPGTSLTDATARQPSGEGMLLNPSFVEALMGFPADFTRLPSLLSADGPAAPRSPKKSGKPRASSSAARTRTGASG